MSECTFTYEMFFFRFFSGSTALSHFALMPWKETDLLSRNNFAFFTYAFNWRHAKTVLSMVTNNVLVYQRPRSMKYAIGKHVRIKKENLIKNDLRIRIENKWTKWTFFFYSLLAECRLFFCPHSFLFHLLLLNMEQETREIIMWYC